MLRKIKQKIVIREEFLVKFLKNLLNRRFQWLLMFLKLSLVLQTAVVALVVAKTSRQGKVLGLAQAQGQRL